jgi:four helix bundle protein
MEFRFESLRVYQEALEFAHTVYSITKKWPSPYQFSLTNQFQRAALSISLNIAEGSGKTKKDFQHFLSIARGSCYECIPIIQLAYKDNLLTIHEHDALRTTIVGMAKMLTALRAKI